jgi:2-keto-4-pentenoate hydratase/2-oxohepta-3-ene-1,7-dioic acid hydratase in catechol pathway
MRLVTYSEARRTEARLGALLGDDVVDLNRLCAETLRRSGDPRPLAAADLLVPPAMRPFLEAGEPAMARARELLGQLERAAGDGRAREALAQAGVVHPRAGVTLRPPVPEPRKIVCLGLNYRDHAEETGLQPPAKPILFPKWATTLIGPGEPIVLPAASQQVDYEVEFCVVIGRRAKNVPAERAREYVAGYTIVNDVSARDWQFHTTQWGSGKNFDTFCPSGPALVTGDEVGDPHALDVSLTLNGQTMQRSNTRMLIFNVWETIAYVSTALTLEPGDLIPTGTPAGVGFSRKPPVFLKPGDVCRLEIARLGVLENPVAAEQGRRG